MLSDWLSDEYYDTLIARGLTRRATLVGMWTPALAPPRRRSPSIVFRRVETEDDLAHLAALNDRAYGFGSATSLAWYAHYLHAPQSQAFVGFVDDTPVTCAAAFPTPHGVYLASVATAETHRGRGYGEAATRHALGPAGEATRLPLILFASRFRARFYQPLGFVAGAELLLFRAE